MAHRATPDWAAIAGQSVAAVQEIEKYVADKLPYLMEWLQKQGESPANPLVAKAVFKRKYRDRLEEFKRYYEAAVSVAGAEQGSEPQAQECEATSSSQPPEQEGEIGLEATQAAEPAAEEARDRSARDAGDNLPGIEVASGDPFVEIFGQGGGLELVESTGIVRVASLDRADPEQLRRIQVHLINEMRAERLRPAMPRGDGDYEYRTYRLPSKAVEDLKKLGDDVRFGRLGIIRLVRAALATAVFCVEERLPIYREGPIPESELILGVSRMDHSGSKKVGLLVHKDLVQKLEQICETALLYPSDLAVLGVEQLLAFVRRAERKAQNQG